MHRLKVDGKNGIQRRGLGANGQGIMDPIEAVVWPRYVGIGCVPKDVGESSKTIREGDPKTVTETLEVNSSSRDETDLV